MKQEFDVERNPRTMAYFLERDTVNRRCNRCGSVVLTSDTEVTKPLPQEYDYQCMFCDEDLFEIETHIGEDHTDEEVDELLCQVRDLLCLDDKEVK